MKLYRIILPLCFFFHLFLSAQNEQIDSLKMQYKNATEEEKFETLIELTQVLNYENKEESLKYSTLAYELGQKGDAEMQDKGIYALVSHYYAFHNYDSANIYIEKGLALSTKRNQPLSSIKYLKRKGDVGIYTGQTNESFDYYFKAIDILQTENDPAQLSSMYTSIAFGYYYMDTIELAKKYSLLALDIENELNEGPSQGKLVNLLNVSGFVGADSASAFKYARQAYDMAHQLNDTYYKARTARNLGGIYYAYGDFDNAIAYFFKALKEHEIHEQEYQQAEIRDAIGYMYSEEGRYEEAIEQLEMAVKIFERIKNIQNRSDSYDLLAESYAKTGQFDKAYEALRNHEAISDTLFNQEKFKASAELDAKYERQQQENELLQKDLQLSRQKVLRNSILFGAFGLLFLVFGIFQYNLRQRRQKQQEIELALSIQEAEAKKLKEMDQIKSNFFANISHEFRTPLTLIISPLNEINSGRFKGNLKTYHQIMLRNAQRLLQLINQLLDLSKLEAKQMSLKATEADFMSFIRQLANAFESLASQKQIAYQINTSNEPLAVWLDTDKAEKIINNLINNAFKFTPEEGSITINTYPEDDFAVFEVIDSGIGIAEKDLPHVFDRFYQADSQSTRKYEGSGIGLALSKELVNLHKGEIAVKSQNGQGSTFTVKFPIDNEHLSDIANNEQGELFMSKYEYYFMNNEDVQGSTAKTDPSKINVLIVEDNEDVRFYIKDKLKDNYEIIEAENGKVGLEKAIETIPDLIITDVMMPVMDGNEFLKKIRATAETNHIPVIMLTAKGDMESKLEGLHTGADDYLTKPLDSRELLARIDNLIKQRKTLREKYANELILTYSKGEAPQESSDPNEVFMQQLMDIIHENLENENFGVEDLSKALHLSRYQLLRKVKALSNRSASAFIRWVRLNKAKDLLEEKAGTVSDIAFKMGFSSVAYFSKCFKDEFGQSPSKF
ncbi:MAG: ATP-binding protein [Bacteroidota bacterium]